MAAPNRKHGKLSRVLMSVSATTEPILIKSLNSFTFDAATDMADTTSFEDGNTTSVPGFPGGKGTFAGTYDVSEKTIWAAAKSADGSIVMWYPDYTNDTSHYIRMPAWVSASIDAKVKDAQKVSGTWEANGTIINALDT